jgi:GGDEF domain-containing protein
VVDCFKEDIRAGVDIAARMDEQDFLIAMPGSPLKKAEEIAAHIKNKIVDRVKTSEGLVVEVAAGVAEYSMYTKKMATTADEVDALIRLASEKSGV